MKWTPSAPGYRQLAAIPHRHLLESRIRRAYEANNDNWSSLEGALELPPYALAAAANALLTLARAEQNAIESVRARTELTPRTILILQLEDSEYDPMAFAVDAFLESACRVQNSLWVYLSKVLRKSIPMSMVDLISKLKRGKPILPDEISSLILNCWEISGKRLRDYRVPSPTFRGRFL